ncbi:MAG TPA: hypothetical protein VNU26_07975 [Mycobacteriales bacterium]|nr:hypothetical protein [Mycobacteriales bacterium]
MRASSAARRRRHGGGTAAAGDGTMRDRQTVGPAGVRVVAR